MSKKIMLGLIVGALAFSVACKSEIDNKPAAQVNEPAAEKEDVVEKEESLTIEVPINKEQSKIGWYGAKVTGDHTGGFNEWVGTATFDGDKELEKVSFEVQTASIFSDAERLTNHLKSADFFDVEKYPTATFESTKIAEGSDVEGYTHTLTGNMTMLDVTKELSVPIKMSIEDNVWTADSEFKFNRFDFNIVYKGMPDDLIKEEVAMTLKFVANLDADAKADEKAEDEASEDTSEG